MTDAKHEQSGYFELIRNNVHFRRLWIGNVVSLLGDWFNFIALINVVGGLTNSPLALGIIFIAKMLPAALASPVAGLLVDRFDRRRLMIGSDLLRAVAVAGLIYADVAGSVALVYVLTVLQVVISSVFQPAQSASIPNVTSPRELLTANALMAASWSVMLAIGAAVGGVITSLYGSTVVFAVDAMTYLVSAVFILRARIPQETADVSSGSLIRAAHREMVEGWRYLRAHGGVARISFAKAIWAIGGGALVYMLALAGAEIDPEAQDIAIGVLFAARGIGTGIGPVVVRTYFSKREQWPALLGLCMAFSGAGYVVFGLLPWSYGLALLVAAAHASSGANWVLATVMLQERTVDRYRGRVFATEWLLVMAADTVSILAAAVLLELQLVTLRGAVVGFAVLLLVSGILWVRIVAPRESVEVSHR